ncbi:ABC transporter ATP-binding protein, partial [Candidatus Parcubacteria bacterium]
MRQPAIKVQGLWKEYVVGRAQQRHTTFYELLSSGLKAPLRRLRHLGGQATEQERFWALRDI